MAAVAATMVVPAHARIAHGHGRSAALACCASPPRFRTCPCQRADCSHGFVPANWASRPSLWRAPALLFRQGAH